MTNWHSQLEKILDEDNKETTDLIVQFSSIRDKQLEDLIQAAVETEQNRAMVVDPRHILPPPSQDYNNNFQDSESSSLAANIKYKHKIEIVQNFNSEFQNDYKNFLSLHAVNKAISKIGDEKQNLPLALNNISGIRITLLKDSINDVRETLSDLGNKISGIYANSTIPAPTVVESLEQAVETERPYKRTTWGLEKCGALSAWSTFETRGQHKQGNKIRVAVLDTGVHPSHSDIKDSLVDFAEFDTLGNTIASGLSSARDSGLHGTHVAGTIVGKNQSGSWIGVAPDAELISGLVLDGKKGGTIAQVVSGIDWAVKNNAHIINLSLGGLTFEPEVGTPYQRAIADALVRGTLVVAAIGNDGHQTSGAPGNDYFTLAVGAHDKDTRCAGFCGGRTHRVTDSDFIDNSNLPLIYTKPDLSAPGVKIKSCVPGKDGEDNWMFLNGTSMAAPHVSGSAALLLASTEILNMPPEQRAFLTRDLLLGGVTDYGEAGQDQRYGYGSVNVLKSIDEALARGY